MIKRLTLQNWRNYEDFTANFEAGTTFVVAPNGVGKTSLVEAARWALFGNFASDGNAAIRVGSSSARVIVELELPDLRVLSVERTLSSKARGASAPPVVRLDGAQVPDKDLEQHLIDAYGAEPNFLAGLTMPGPNRNLDGPSASGLEDHLGRYYGVDNLKNAVNRLNAEQKINSAKIKQIKDANSTSAQRLADLQNSAKETARRVDEATTKHTEVTDRLTRAREHERRLAELRKCQADHTTWLEAVEELAVRVSATLGRHVSAENMDSVLSERVAELHRQIEATRVKLAVNLAKVDALRVNEERLSAAHEDCPVCRRQLDDATVALAHRANNQELSALRKSISDLRVIEAELIAQHKSIQAAQTECQQIPQPGKSPQPPATDDGSEPIPTDRVSEMAKTALDTLVKACADHEQAMRELDQARNADHAIRELESLFKREATFKIAIQATEATLRELLDETIRPLAREVNQRWKVLFPDRGDLKTYSDGRVTRKINGHHLPSASFSTGETVGASILLRLLVAEMATTTDFCWFDEPLEHLDPDVRRQVASLLSRVASGVGPLRQLVVTTYEEPLARHLQARDRGRVHLLDVRHVG